MNKIIIILCFIFSHGLLYLKGHNDGAFELSNQLLMQEMEKEKDVSNRSTKHQSKKDKFDELNQLNDLDLKDSLGERAPASEEFTQETTEDFSFDAESRPYKELGQPIEEL